MQRLVEKELNKWRQEKEPKPIIFRGARQVGKTYLVRKFAEQFGNFVEINFELKPELQKIFVSLEPQEIIEAIYRETREKVILGKTLIFLDEIQNCPQAIKALRYFYEMMPGLHVIAAGSLLDFVLDSSDISVPVGRVKYLFIQALSFEEYLLNKFSDDDSLFKSIKSLNLESPLKDGVHEFLLKEVKHYSLLGGMPGIVKEFISSSTIDSERLAELQSEILLSYREDFGKYSNLAQHKYLETVFAGIPRLIGEKFKYSTLNKEMRAKDLRAALDLLSKAGLAHIIERTSASGLPFAATASQKNFKVIFNDIGLTQKLLGNTVEIINQALNNSDFHSIAAGKIAEAFVGQELLGLLAHYEERKLYYWEREQRNSSAEVDYLIAIDAKIYPIEVKAGKTGRLRSLHILMKEYNLKLGIRISEKKLGLDDGILSVPFYAITEIPRIIRELSKNSKA